MSSDFSFLAEGLPLDPLPSPEGGRDPSVAHAPRLRPDLSPDDRTLALQNALRYFPQHLHAELASEFAQELQHFGHIYMYRFRPRQPLKAVPLASLPAKSRHAGAIMLMILNNLDPAVAQFPQELVTYGGNGQVFSNWAQFRLTMALLSEMSDDQTLALFSGHPHGLFPSHEEAPRAVITNGMMIPNYSAPLASYQRLFALGVTQYGQMTAGSFCYIGPQGIVHGTTLTLLNAGRKHLPAQKEGVLAGRLFISSGLGGMSGAQGKAAVIAGCVGVIAEVSKEALDKRHAQGWLTDVSDSLDDVLVKVRSHLAARKGVAIGYFGNVVDLWERLAKEDLQVDLGSDQTSCHNPFNGGYYPAGFTFEEARAMMADDPQRFKEAVRDSLRRQIKAINVLTARGMHFFDYGNAFLLQSARAGAEVMATGSENCPPESGCFRYPTYIQDVLGDVFDQGFGPFRWVCTTCEPDDLATTDRLAQEVLSNVMKAGHLPEKAKEQYEDNLRWIQEAGDHHLVVGSQARILYSDMEGRCKLAERFNQAIAAGEVRGPIVISRDHHDVSGTDSPFRETSNVRDGSNMCADMAVQNCIGDAFRGATWVALHNGGGCGWGEVINGGFGLVLDGSPASGQTAAAMLAWDVNNGVTRRAWAGSGLAREAIKRAEAASGGRLRVTLPEAADEEMVRAALRSCVFSGLGK